MLMMIAYKCYFRLGILVTGYSLEGAQLCYGHFHSLKSWVLLWALTSTWRNELFSHFGNSMFPPAVKFSHHPNLEILGAPIGDYLYCSKFIAGKCADARKLLSSLVDVAAVDPLVALSLLRMCGSYCRLVHLARATPSSLAGSLKLFDEEVRRFFSSCFSIDTTDTAWTQAQLSLGCGGLGLRSLSHHSCAAFIASLSTSGCSNADNVHLHQPSFSSTIRSLHQMQSQQKQYH